MPCLIMLMVKGDIVTDENKKKVDDIVTQMLIDIKDAVKHKSTDDYGEYVYRAAMAIRALEEAKDPPRIMNWGQITTVGENGELNIYNSQEEN